MDACDVVDHDLAKLVAGLLEVRRKEKIVNKISLCSIVPWLEKKNNRFILVTQYLHFSIQAFISYRRTYWITSTIKKGACGRAF